MSELAPKNDALDLKLVKTFTKDASNKSAKSEEDEADTKTFLKSLYECIDKSNLPNADMSQKELVYKTVHALQKGVFDEEDKISIFDSSSFMQILSLLDKLKTQTTDLKLANFSQFPKQARELVKSQSNFDALKRASNLEELLDIAKDLGLNVKNIKVDRLLDLKASFVNLDRADFFKSSVDKVFKELINEKLSHITKNLKPNLQANTPKLNAKENNDTLLYQTLKNLDAMLLAKKDSKKEEDIYNDKNLKTTKDIQTKYTQNLSSSQKDLSSKISIKEDKIIKQNDFDQKISFENLHKIQTPQNKDHGVNFNSSMKEAFNQEQAKSSFQNTDKNSLEDVNFLMKDFSKITQNSIRNINAKESLEHFSYDLKEAIKQYKAPLTKLTITLNPSNLGEVEVSLVQRGNNLHINFNSNTNAMNLFIQHQAEFKNSLINMGFTALEMNFSDQGKKEQSQNQGKNRRVNDFKDILEEKKEDQKPNVELVLARYF